MSSQQPLRILMVEDVPADAELIERELRRGGIAFESVCVANSEDLLAALSSFSPDLILSDYNLPGFDGTEVLRIASAMTPDVPFIFVSGSIGEERAIDALKGGATDYVIKDRLQRLPSAVLRAVEDVAQRIRQHRADAALRESEERFRFAARATNDGVWDWDVKADRLWLSEMVFTMFRIKSAPGLFPLRWWLERLHPEDREVVEDSLQRALDGTDYQWTCEYRFLRGDEIWAHIRDRGYIIREGDGTPRRMIGAMQDVTEQKASEEEILRLNRWNKLVLNAAGNAICAVDTEGLYISANPKAVSMTQWQIEESLGRFRHGLVHHTRADGTPYAWEECPVYLTLQDGKVRQVRDEVLWRRDGTRVPVEYSVTPIMENFEVVGAVEVTEDVTSRKVIEGQLEQASRLAGLGKLAATIAHEFNNVLMGIQPFAELINRRADETDFAQPSARILESVKRGKKITQEILRFTQPSTPDLQNIEVGEWLRQFVDDCRGPLQTSASISVEVEEDLCVAADPVHLHQVFSNLVFNARDAMPDGGVITVIARAGSLDYFPFGSIENVERYVHFQVVDEGKGIPKSALPFIFDPLFTTKRSGTGLGLAVSSQIILNHGGHIMVDSQEGVGTTFHVFLPQGTSEPAVQTLNDASKRTRPRRILLVEDDPSVSEGLALLLRLEGTEVEVVECGADVPAAMDRFEPELIVLDIGLPDMSGIDVYRELIRRMPDMPVIFSTGHGDEATVQEFGRNEKVSFLLKPYDADSLLSRMETLLEHQSGVPESRREGEDEG